MPLTENATTTDPASLEGMSTGLGGEPHNVDQIARQQAALLAFGRLNNTHPDLSVLMQDGVALVAEVLDADLGIMGSVSGGDRVSGDDRELVVIIASRKAQGGRIDPLVHKYSLEPGNSMAAYALNAASPLASTDLAAEKRFKDLFLRNLGVTSALIVPLHLNKEPFGVLGVCSREPREFSGGSLAFAETIAQLLTSSIARGRAEEALSDNEILASNVLEMVDSLVLTIDAECKITSANRAVETVSGFSKSALQGKPFCDTFLTPDQIHPIQKTLREAIAGRPVETFESQLVGKSGEKREISWSLRVVGDRPGTANSLLLTGKDRTLEVQATANLQYVKEKAAGVSEELRRLRAQNAKADSAVQKPQPKPASGPASKRQAEDGRSSPRRSFNYRQLIAPVYGSTLPTEADFIEVDCQDISAGGVSFSMDSPPDFNNLVVALGKPPGVSYFAARVLRIMEKDIDGQRKYIIGCRFTGRAQL